MLKRVWCTAFLVGSCCLVSSCESGSFEIGVVQYCRMSPRIPSVPVKGVDYDWEPYVVIWGILGTVNEDGPKMVPKSVELGGASYTITNIRTHNGDHRGYYIFEVRDQNPVKGLPRDLMTGNLFATPEEKRNRLPVEIIFKKAEDGTVWRGEGLIEQSTLLTMRAVEEKMGGP